MGFFLMMSIIVTWIFFKHLIMVKLGDAVIIERLGIYNRTLHSGVHFYIPFLEKIKCTINLKEQILEVVPQVITTKDKQLIKVNLVIFYKITDAQKNAYSTDDLKKTIQFHSLSAVNKLIGEINYSEAIATRSNLNHEIAIYMDDLMSNYGCKINFVEITNIMPTTSTHTEAISYDNTPQDYITNNNKDDDNPIKEY